MDFVEICTVCARKAMIKFAKRQINSDKICRSYSDLNFGVTFWNTVYVCYSVNVLLVSVYCYCVL